MGGGVVHAHVGHVCGSCDDTHSIQHTALVIIFTRDPSKVKKILHSNGDIAKMMM